VALDAKHYATLPLWGSKLREGSDTPLVLQRADIRLASALMNCLGAIALGSRSSSSRVNQVLHYARSIADKIVAVHVDVGSTDRDAGINL